MKENSNRDSRSDSHQELVLEKLDLILKRMDAMESRLEKAESALKELPGVAVTAVNTLDEYFADHASEASELGQKIPQALNILETVAASDLLDSLELLSKRLDQFQPWLEMVADVPGMLLTTVDSLDETVAHYRASGIDVLERGHQGLELLLQLTEPRMLKTFKEILDQRETLGMLVEFLRDTPGIVTMMIDTLDEMWLRYAPEGGQIDAMLDDVRHGILDPAAVSVVASAGRAMAESARHPHSAGPLSLLKAMKEPEFRRSLGFLLTFVRDFSQRLDNPNYHLTARQNGRN